MSMLAERKRKQKWSLNPRGNDWVQDSNKFGQKMLEKMGWQHGKGLGANENGITEHIKVSYKNDSKGMGFKESNDQWTEHETNFSALLESLSGGKPAEVKLNSLEKKSQKSRARVHYHKFTRGKDLSRYSEKDLANIFGKKSLKELSKLQTEDEKSNDVEEENESNTKFLFNAGSMKDYFKKKLPGFGKSNGYIVGQNGVLKKGELDSEISGNITSEDEVMYTGFGFKSNSESTKTANKFMEDSGGVNGVSNPAFNPLQTPVKVQKHILEPIVECTFEESLSLESTQETEVIAVAQVHDKPRKKKKHLLESTSSNLQLDDKNAVEKRRKSKKYVENGVENEIFSVDDVVDLTNGNENGVEALCYEVKRKESKKRRKVAETISQSFDLTSDISSGSATVEETPSKKKKKKLSYAIDNPHFDQQEDSVDLRQIEDNPYEVKTKKKKKKVKDGIDNLNFSESIDESTSISQNEENPYEVIPKQKKKKKKKKETEYFAIENPNFNESLEESPCVETKDNPYEVKQKKKKKKKDGYAIDNPNFNPDDSLEASEINSDCDAKYRKKVTKQGKEEFINVPSDNSNSNITSPNIGDSTSWNIEESDLMLNVVVTPIIKRNPQENNEATNSVISVSSLKRRKSVRFSDVTQEKTIPNNDDIRKQMEIKNRNELFEINTQVISNGLEEQNINFDMSELDKINFSESPISKRNKKRKLGLDNAAFDKQKTNLEENLNSIAKTIDRYEAEIENDINEKKLESLTMEDLMIGEVGNPNGEHERLPEGVKLKFKYANFTSKTPFYQLDKVGAKKSYKHLIKGDIVVGFRDANLHEIQGYAIRNNNRTIV